jgi:hypothetical protein
VPVWMNERSMFLLNPQNRVRLLLQRITSHRFYRASRYQTLACMRKSETCNLHLKCAVSVLQFVSLGMVAVSILGNLWTPPVGRTFTKASLRLRQTIPMPQFFQIADIYCTGSAKPMALKPAVLPCSTIQCG